MRRDVARLAAGWLLCASLLLPRTAIATERVVVVTAREAAGHRLVAELRQRGFTAVLVDGQAEASPEHLEALAATEQALAAILLRAGPEGLTIWVADRATGKLVTRRIDAHEGVLDDDVAITKAVELLRASLLELRVTPPPSAVPREVGALVDGPAAPSPADPSVLRLAPTLAFGSSGLPPALQLGVEWVVPFGPMAVGLGAALPTVPAMQSDRGFDLAQGRGSLEGTVELQAAPGPRVRLRAGATAGLEIAHAVGDPPGGRAAQADTSAAALVLGSLGITLGLGDGVGLDAEAGCGASLPSVSYLARDRVVARVGAPSCRASLGVALDLPDGERKKGEP